MRDWKPRLLLFGGLVVLAGCSQPSAPKVPKVSHGLIKAEIGRARDCENVFVKWGAAGDSTCVAP